MKEITNAKIESTKIGDIYNGIFGFDICFDYGGGGQCIGGYVLDRPIRELGTDRFIERVPDAEAIKKIKEILEVVGVETWEQVKGKYVRVEHSHEKIYRIGNLLEDKWVVITDHE